MRRAVGVDSALVAVLLIAACGSDSNPTGPVGSPEATLRCTGFALSLTSGRGGQRTPVAAAWWCTLHGGIDVRLPRSGWQRHGHDTAGVIVQSGTDAVHVVQGVDKTWQVDSGKLCRGTGRRAVELIHGS